MSSTEVPQQGEISEGPKLISVVEFWQSSTPMERIGAVVMCAWGTLTVFAFATAFLLAY